LDDLIYTGEFKCKTTLDGYADVGHYPKDKTMPKLTMCERLSEEDLHIFVLTCQADDFQGAFVAIAADMVKPMLTGEWYTACKGKSWKGCIPVPVDTACPRDPPSAFGVDYVTTVGPSGTKALWKAAGKTWEPVSNDAAFGQMVVSAAQLLNVVKAGVGGVKQCAIEELEQTVQYELLRANTEGTITPTTLKKAHLTARSLTRGTHNNTLTETRTAAKGEVGARVFGEMKASSNKEFEPGIYGSFTVASVVVDEDARRHDALRVGVNVSDNKYLPLLVYHTGAVVVQVRVKSLAQCHDVPAEALEDPFYIVMSTESRDVVEDLTYTPAGSERTNGTKIPVAVIAAPYLNKNVKDVEAVKWGTARASEAFKAAVRHGICRADDLPSKLDEVLAEYYQTMRVQARKLWAGKAAAAEGETTPTTDAGKRGRFVSPKKGQDAGRTRTGGGHVSSTAGGVPF
jgi:hypothetical protein